MSDEPIDAKWYHSAIFLLLLPVWIIAATAEFACHVMNLKHNCFYLRDRKGSS